MKRNVYIEVLIYFIFVPFCAGMFEEELLKLTNEIVEIYFNQFNCLTYITENTTSAPSLRPEKLILNIDVTGDFKQDKILVESYNTNCTSYVLRVRGENKEKTIRSLINAYRNSTNHYNRQRYLYLPYDEKDSNTDVLNKADMYWVPNLIMITSTALNNHFNFSIIGHNFFHGLKYDILGIKHEIVDTWTFDNGFHRNADLYPDKIKNLNCKKLMLSTLNYQPYSLVFVEGNKTILDGLETRIIATFVELINGTWEGYDNPIELWGKLYDNGTADGILGSVMNHKADMGYAALYQWYCDIISCSYPYVYAGVTCLVPRPELVAGWLTVVLPFTPKTWIALISVFVISSCFVFFVSVVLQRMRDKMKRKIFRSLAFDAFFITLRLQLEQIPQEARKKTSLGIYLKFLTVYYFFVANCWSGGIASILTVPRYGDPINEVEDLLKRWPALKWGGTSTGWTISIEQTSEPILREIVNKFVEADDEALRKKIKTKDFAFFMERLPSGHYGMENYVDEESLKYLKIMEGNVYTANVVILLPKGSPYKEELDMLIIRMLDTGLLQKYETQISLEKINNRLQNLIKSSNEKPTEELTCLEIRHLQGPLIFFLGGIALSILAFAAEICIHKVPLSSFTRKFKDG